MPDELIYLIIMVIFKLMMIFLLCVIILLIFYTVAELRKPPRKKKQKFIVSFITSKEPKDALSSIVRYALTRGFYIDYYPNEMDNIVLSDKPTIWSSGFFYPIYLSKSDDGQTLVEVGVRGKVSIIGSFAFRYRDRVFNALKAAVAIDF